jgi:hypothetical protein
VVQSKIGAHSGSMVFVGFTQRLSKPAELGMSSSS